MKNLMAAIALFVGLTVNAHAWWVNAGITVTPGVVTATVVNTYGRPIVCSGYAFGRVYSGMVAQSWLNSSLIWPGQYVNVHVYSQWEPFANGWAQIDCRWY